MCKVWKNIECALYIKKNIFIEWLKMVNVNVGINDMKITGLLKKIIITGGPGIKKKGIIREKIQEVCCCIVLIFLIMLGTRILKNLSTSC